MHIVFAVPECAPWAKTGGLADVAAALPRQLVKLGHKVSLFVPYYRQTAKMAPDATVLLPSVTVPFPRYSRFVQILDGGLSDGVQTYFVACPEMFDREYLYATPSGDYADNAERFGLFSRAVIEATKTLGVPDIFHVHDWQTAVLAVLLRSTYFFDPLLRHVPVVLTVHNAGYQGWSPAETMETLLLPRELFTPDKLEFYNQVNLLKGGIVYSDAITTVSRKYAGEIQTSEFGDGLEGIFRQRSGDLFGILNGVDYMEWDPAHDSRIAAHYTADDLAGKQECRRDLLHAFGFHDVSESAALLGVVSRFSSQKGFDFLVEIMDRLVDEDIVVAMLGNGEEYYERLLSEMANRFPDKIRIHIRYDDVMAHKVHAGSDMLLVPSRWEPSGLNQLYSLRYGTVPVVRATGGLDDTIDERPDGNGFKFWGYDSNDLLDAIKRALAVFRNKREWTETMRRGMAQDFGWEKPALEYVRVYERAVSNRN